MSAPVTDDRQQRLDALNDRVEKASLKGAWQRDRGPRTQEEVRPWVWRWHDVLPNLLESGALVPIDDVMRMRTLRLVNPSQPTAFGTTRTFGVTLQHLNPGEVTESHRHTPQSIYFMIQGGGTYTTAEGEQQFMEPGDLLVQPSWNWHGTRNTSEAPAIWLTSMDINLTNYLDVWFRERYPDGKVQPASKSEGYYRGRMGALRPGGAPEGPGPFPFKYTWQESLDALENLAASEEIDPREGVVLDYTDPMTGGPTTATLACRIQMLRPGEETQMRRQTCSSIHHVVRGAGCTRVGKSKGDEDTLEWGERDCFNIPPWQWHSFHNGSAEESAILFSVSDRPLLQAIKLFREEF